MAKQFDKDGKNTGIAWTDYTLNLWWGCTEVHEGCDNCYARVLAHRWGFEVWGAKGVRRIIKGALKSLNKFQKEAKAAGAIRTVFVGSMMDIFEKDMPLVDDGGKPVDETLDTRRYWLFRQIEDGCYPNLLFLLLTKRPSNINKYIPEHWREQGAPQNVMFGTSVVNQETADKLIPQLLEVKGRRFLSMEPLLGPVNLQQYLFMPRHNGAPADIDPTGQVEWIIVGGESGSKARPMEALWCHRIMLECHHGGVKFHMKQGSQANWPDFKHIESFPPELRLRQYATE